MEVVLLIIIALPLAVLAAYAPIAIPIALFTYLADRIGGTAAGVAAVASFFACIYVSTLLFDSGGGDERIMYHESDYRWENPQDFDDPEDYRY